MRCLSRASIAATTAAACMLVTPSTANASNHDTLTIVSWGGSSICIWITSPTFGDYWSKSTDYVCDEDQEVQVRTPASSGQYVGADPFTNNPGIRWAGCTVIIDGNVDFADYAEYGDVTDVNCLRVLK